MKLIPVSNATWKKIRKVQAISWNPVDIFYDVLTTSFSSNKLARKFINKIGSDGKNEKLSQRKFKPVSASQIAIDDFYASEGVNQCEKTLKENGVCVLKNFVDHDVALNAGMEVRSLLSKLSFVDKEGYVKAPKERELYENQGDYEWQVELAKYKNYQQIVSAGKPVFNIRSQKPNEPDSGMVDVFYIEQLAKKYEMKNLLDCYQAIREKTIDDFLTRISGYAARQSNLYYNAGVVSTRGPHIDNNSEQYKIFIYLTDVLHEDNGPYCYVPGSHIKRDWMSRERVISSAKGFPSTEVSSFQRENATRLLAPAGTAIISCQSGIHFGWHQSMTGSRIVLIGNYN